jgi:hypothetical protein
MYEEIDADACPICCGPPMTFGGLTTPGPTVRCGDCSNIGVVLSDAGVLVVDWDRTEKAPSDD